MTVERAMMNAKNANSDADADPDPDPDADAGMQQQDDAAAVAWAARELAAYCEARAARMRPRPRGGGEAGDAELELHEVDEDAAAPPQSVEEAPAWAAEALDVLQKAGLPELCKVRGLETVFCEAATQGREDAMRILLEAFPGAINPGCMQQAAIRESARNGHLACVRLLLELGADPDLSGALRFAAEQGHVEICRSLLASRTHFDEYSLGAALRLASARGSVECVTLLLDHGADPAIMHSRACQRAAMHGHAKVVKVLLQDPRTEIPESRADDIFRKACVEGWPDVVSELLRRSRLCPSPNLFAQPQSPQPDQACIVELLRAKAFQRQLSHANRHRSTMGPGDELLAAAPSIYLRELLEPSITRAAALGPIFVDFSERSSPHVAARILALAFCDHLLVSHEALEAPQDRFSRSARLVLALYSSRSSSPL